MGYGQFENPDTYINQQVQLPGKQQYFNIFFFTDKHQGGLNGNLRCTTLIRSIE
jgi:hypothetical protein